MRPLFVGNLHFSGEDKDTITNPAVIFEILSPPTENDNLGKKFISYMTITSLKQYITIGSTGLLVRSGLRKSSNAWKFEEFSRQEESILLEATGQELLLRNIYRTISFP